MNEDDFSDFLTEMQDVAKIEQGTHVLNETKRSAKKQINNTINNGVRQQAATQETLQDDNHLSADYVQMVLPSDYLEFRRDGVALGVYRRLRQGKYDIEARLDLHKKSVEQARNELFQFIKDCQTYGVRTAIVLPGKGERSVEVKALLKSHVNNWLPCIDEVLAFCSAQQHHGGVGAVYVLIKKSDEEKQRNREKFRR
jgi:DNA-nicking Smr family endonuclease